MSLVALAGTRKLLRPALLVPRIRLAGTSGSHRLQPGGESSGVPLPILVSSARQRVMRDSCDAGPGESPGNDFDLSRWTRR